MGASVSARLVELTGSGLIFLSFIPPMNLVLYGFGARFEWINKLTAPAYFKSYNFV